MDKLVAKCKDHFKRTFKSDPKPLYLGAIQHVEKVQAWAEDIVKDYEEADIEVLLCAVWLHDIGFFVIEKLEDHAIASEIEARKFLGQNQVEDKKIEKIAHCVRTHRCRDLMPESIEAKILAVSDSASHFNDSVYADMLAKGLRDEVYEKIERDYRDVGLLAGIKPRLEKLYKAWKNLISVFSNA